MDRERQIAYFSMEIGLESHIPLGYEKIKRFHMNEGHASLLTLELLNERAGKAEAETVDLEDVKAVHDLCVFTTHTPVPAGHDQFPMDLVKRVVAHPLLVRMEDVFCPLGTLNMTHLALNLSRYVSGVAKKHGEISRHMFAPYHVFLENYDMDLSRMIVSGVDVWLNTPEPPLEASGTSGMKAAINGVPSLSVLDGWWIEGCIEGVTGWAIGRKEDAGFREERSKEEMRRQDGDSLYQKLEEVIVPMYYRERDEFTEVMSGAIALNGSFFNSQRMLQQYVLKAYF
jgi:glucan phosphorylase